ncbi:MAG: alpha/beta hydrolase [Bacteroidota bacterium]
MIKRIMFCGIMLLYTTIADVIAQNQTDAVDSWNYTYDLHYAEIDDSTQIAFVDEGPKAFEVTLLFIHGLGSNLEAWRKNIEELSENYRCIALDLPGYGKSSTGDYPFTMTYFADAVKRFAEHLELENIILVGHSMGGQVAMHTALKEEMEIARLVLVAPAGIETFSDQDAQWLKQVVTPLVIKMTPPAQVVKNFEANFHEMPDDARFMIDDRMQLIESPQFEAFAQMIPRCMAGMLDEPVFDRLGEIKLKTLIIYGESDGLIPNKYLHPELTVELIGQAAKEAMPNAVLLFVPNAGHFVQWEGVDMVNTAIDGFARSQSTH